MSRAINRTDSVKAAVYMSEQAREQLELGSRHETEGKDKIHLNN